MRRSTVFALNIIESNGLRLVLNSNRDRSGPKWLVFSHKEILKIAHTKPLHFFYPFALKQLRKFKPEKLGAIVAAGTNYPGKRTRMADLWRSNPLETAAHGLETLRECAAAVLIGEIWDLLLKQKEIRAFSDEEIQMLAQKFPRHQKRSRV
ncbi:MAG TPA: hypothetical protein VFQ60_01940 [Patescibacteria group bacterium]|nr:hypothetical protein [Patescibacteria group bacterium]